MVAAIKQALLNTTASGALDSLYETDPLFTYHFVASALAQPNEGGATPGSNTIYRIGSIPKLLTMYIYLISAGSASRNDPVTDYVPELAKYADAIADVLETDKIDMVDWKDVTVGALASQLASIGRDTALPPVFEWWYVLYGLPPVPPSKAAYYGSPILPEPCDRAGKLILAHPDRQAVRVTSSL
jgi:CubicO group peptidase (beta-lactamase class C family)